MQLKKGDYPYTSTQQLTLYNSSVASETRITNKEDIGFYLPLSPFLMDFMLA
jgi:hypothetical protein